MVSEFRFRLSRLAEYSDEDLEAFRQRLHDRAEALLELSLKYQGRASSALTEPELVNRSKERVAAIKSWGARSVTAAKESDRASKGAVACEVEQALRRGHIEEV